MSFFWRLTIGFAVAIFAMLLTQRTIAWLDPGVAPVSRLAVMGSPLVAHEGAVALAAYEERGPDAALTALRPLQESGLRAWLVTKKDVVGLEPLPRRMRESVREAVARGEPPEVPMGFRAYAVHTPGQDGYLVVTLVAGTAATFQLMLRGILLVAVPVLFCLALARWAAAPIERLRLAAHRLSEGDLNSRVGPVKGPREAAELAQTFDSMAERLQGTMEAQQTMLRDASHEVRSPLARIRLATQMLREGKGDPTTNVERIERDVERLDELMEALGAVVRTGRAPVDLEKIELGQAILDAVEVCRPDFEAKGIELKLDLAEASIQGDRRLLASAIENVLGNAIAYSNPETVIEIAATAHPATLRVSDTGPGVPPEHLARIFEPFFRVADSRERRSGGVGLGLSIVQRVAAMHGGKAWAENRPESGLTVTVTFEA